MHSSAVQLRKPSSSSVRFSKNCMATTKRENVFPILMNRILSWLVTDGRVKLKGLKLEPKSDPLILQNYQNACKILETTMLGEYPSDDIPEDIKHQLEMTSDSANCMEHVISTQASLVPVGNRYQFFMQMHEQINSVLHLTAAQGHILNALSYDDDWGTILQGNLLLDKSFKFRKYDPSKGTIEFLEYYRNTVCA